MMRRFRTLLLTVLLGAAGVGAYAQQPVAFRAGPSWGPLVTDHFTTVAGDFNGDGYADLITRGTELDLGDGAGSFALQAPLLTMAVPFDCQTADFDRDGDLDLAFLLGYPLSRPLPDSTRLVLLLNDGRAHFTESYRVHSPFTGSLTVADFDGDQYPDLALIKRSAQGYIQLRLNNGAATAFAAVDLPQPVRADSWPAALVSGDLDGNGTPDLVLALNSNLIVQPDTLYTWLNAGNSQFRRLPGLRRDTPRMPTPSGQLLIGDFTGDGVADLASFGSCSTLTLPDTASWPEVFVNDGTGQFTHRVLPNPLPYPAGRMTAVATADLNGDGTQDLLLLGSVPGDVVCTALVATGNGQFTASAPLPIVMPLSTGIAPAGILPCDVDGNGTPDVVVEGYDHGPDYFLGVAFNDRPAGLPAATGRTTFTLSPNPAHGTVRLSGLPPSTGAVQVLDAVGRTVLVSHLESGTSPLELPLQGLLPGVYTVRVGVVARRLVVE